MQQRREQLLQELSTAEQARDLLSELERFLQEENLTEENLTEENRPELGHYVTELERLAQSLPEGHRVRLLIESAVDPGSVGGVSRARSAIEGEIWTLRGALEYHSR